MLGPTIHGLEPALSPATTFLVSLALVGILVAAVHRLVRIAKALSQGPSIPALPMSNTSGPAAA